MLSKPCDRAAEPRGKGKDGGPQATVKRIVEAMGSSDISTEDIRLGMPAVRNSDYVGDLKRANTTSLSFGNINKGLF